MTANITALFGTSQTRIQHLSEKYFATDNASAAILQSAMKYAMLNGGKRIRPLLVYATGTALGATLSQLDPAAFAVEMIHTYSLIHDDLPAMDNADLRRGNPSCHKAYNEAIAILAGDALQALAFEVLATSPLTLPAENRLEMIRCLSQACGPLGMAAGQTLDMTGVDSESALIQMYQLKTGALLATSVKLGVLSAENPDAMTITALEKFAERLGLAFQIQDDLLDIQGDSQLMGKPQGIDAINQKNTYPQLLGIEETQRKIQLLYREALDVITCLAEKGAILRELIGFLLHRTS